MKRADAPAGLTVTGRSITGYLALWPSTHAAISAPRNDRFGQFHRHRSRGHIHLDIQPASRTANIGAAQEHYRKAGPHIATVRAENDENGVWINGRTTPGNEHLDGRTYHVWGDWRAYDGKLTLIAASITTDKPNAFMDLTGEQL